MCAMGSCIKVVKQKKIWFPTEKKMLSPVTVQNQNGHFSVIICKKRATFLSWVLHKISSLYAPSEIALQFPPPLRSNNTVGDE
jgi:hypothetical protein